MFNMIAQLTAFGRISIDNLSAAAQSLYLRLILIDNGLGWPEHFYASNSRLMTEAGINNEKTLITARNQLIQMGLVEYKRGTAKGKASTYKLKIIPTTVSTTVSTTGVTTVGTTVGTTGVTTVGTTGVSGAYMTDQYRQDKTRQDKTEREDDDAHVRVQACVREQGLPKIPTEVKSAFEGAFRPLAGLKDMERLSCLLEEFGRRGVLFAVVQARERSQGLERIRDPFSWMRTVLLTEPSPSSRAEGAGRAARQAAEAPQGPSLRDFTHVDPKAYAEELAQKNEELYERSGGDIYGIFGGSGAARES